MESRNDSSVSKVVALPRIKERVFKVEDASVAKFLHGQLKVPKLMPLPDLNKYKVDPFAKHPLMKFKLSAGKSRRVYEFLEEQAIRNKIRTYRSRSLSSPKEPLPISRQDCYRLLREYASQQETPPLQASWILSIQRKLHGLHLKFPDIASALLCEVKTIFYNEMHEFGINLIVKPLDQQPVVKEARLDNGGRTNRYPIFLRRRLFLKSKLHILHPLQRQIFTTAIEVLPDTLTDFTKYRSLGVLQLAGLEELVYGDLKRAEHLVTTTYYSQVVLVLEQKSTWRLVPTKVRPTFLRSATNILRVQICSLIHRSIEHLLWVTEDEQRMPQLNMNIVCDFGLYLLPSQQTIYKTFHGFLDELANTAQKLAPLETWVDDVPVPKGNIQVAINKSFMKQSHEILQKNLEKVLEEVNAYLDGISVMHSSMFTRTTFADLDKFINKDLTFEELITERAKFQEYMNSLDDILLNEFFSIGRMCQYDLIKTLREFSTEYCHILLNKIFTFHALENQKICQTFQELKEKALKEPDSTEELIDMGNFMLGASAAVVRELEGQIYSQLLKMSVIIHLAEVPHEYMRLMCQTVNWITEIQPVFEQNTAQYEQQKFDFEERLQKRTEQLSKDLDELGPKLVVLNNMDDTTRVQDYLQEIKKFLTILEGLDKDVQWINHEEFLFKFPVSTYPELDELHNFINPFAKLLFLTHRWQWKHRVWMNGSFQDLDAVTVETTTEQFFKEFSETQKMYKAKIKQQVQDNVARRFKGNVDDPDPNNIPVPIKICNRTLEQIKEFKVHVPLVKILCNKALMQRHWDEMSAICGFDITPDYGTTLRKVIKMDLAACLDQFEVISIGACKELQLSENLKSMWREWTNIEFSTSCWKDSDLWILSDVDRVQTLVDDHLIKTITMRGSAFVKPFEKEVIDWYNTIDVINKTIEEWERVQTLWLGLLPVFSSQMIAEQMLEQSDMFKEVDIAYKKIIENTRICPRVLKIAGTKTLYNTFHNLLKLLEEIHSGVKKFLDGKRLCFPRFFLLADDEILKILSGGAESVQGHLNKCFEGISSLQIQNKCVTAMVSGEGEVVPFVNQVSIKTSRGCVELMLKQVEAEMKCVMRSSVSEAYGTYNSLPRTEWLQKWPSQAVHTASALLWTARVHQCFESNQTDDLTTYYTTLTQQRNETVAMVCGELTNALRTAIRSLIVLEIHWRDVVDVLIKSAVTSEAAFLWMSQLRYYWLNDDCNVCMINVAVKYEYEYLGSLTRLAMTPQTDRCFKTLLSAYSQHLYGALEGATSSGKTETVKDLAKALAVRCIVFNCSEGVDCTVIAKFLKGIACSGAWLCLDEFHRIRADVASVVAQQLSCIARAVQSSAYNFLFDDIQLQLNPACNVCITLNHGCGMRAQLPDNLRVLFRPIAMATPSLAFIAETLLHSLGFLRAESLSVKIDTTYRLCHEMMSSSPLNKFGLRELVSTLKVAGQLKLDHVELDEIAVIARAIYQVTQPKLLLKDLSLFDDIIQDVFPGGHYVPDQDLFIKAIEKVCLHRNLQCVHYFKEKIVQTHDLVRLQQGVMIVGEPFAGKSTVLSVLAETMQEFGQNVEMHKINPKSVSLNLLYGHDGIFEKTFRDFADSDQPSLKWIILDGPIDAVSIDNLSSVLDDNRRLCLDSGEIINMTKEMSCIFEVLTLNEASPAMISRCGVIYVDAKALGWNVLADSWLSSQDWMGEHAKFIKDLLYWIVPPSLHFISKNCSLVVKRGDSSKVASFLQITKMLMAEACLTPPLHIQVWIQAAFLYAGVWGLGGALEQGSRVLFSDFYLELWRGGIENSPIPESLGRADVTLPTEGTLYDYCYNYKSKGNWRQCSDILKQEKIEEPANIAHMLVPTVETVRYNALIHLHIQHNIPLMLVGATGTGKTAMLQNILMAKLDSSDILPAFVTYTANISASASQNLIISKLVKRKRDVFGPTQGKKCVLFIDDMNMPSKEPCGAQPAVELLRQCIDSGNWYDEKSCSPVYLEDILILSAMGLQDGARLKVTPRLLRHFNVFNVTDTEESTIRIFSAVLFAGLKRNGFASDAMTAVTGIANATFDIYSSILSELRPTPKKSHYVFNLRDFARVVQGCALIKKESVDSRKTFVKLWVHETMRVFYDRLVDDSDRSMVYEKMRICVKEHFKENFDHVFDNLKLDDGVCTETGLRELLFGSYIDQEAPDDDKKYEEITNVDQFLEVASCALTEYNGTNTPKLDLVIFKSALEHLSRICRILAIPGGCGLLIGLSGSGRQSLTRLASKMMGFHLFQPEITSEYSTAEWRNELKNVLKGAGGRARSTTFLLSESQIKDETFMSDIDALLNLGEIPELYNLDEKQELLEMVRLSAQSGDRNLDISSLAVFNFFVARCKQRLHLLLCFSPISAHFRRRLLLYPSLMNCCTIDWFSDWPVDALDMIGKKLLFGVNLPEPVKQLVIGAGKYFHTSAMKLSDELDAQVKRKIYITSVVFVELMSTFSQLTNKTQEQTKASKLRYTVGLEKLEFAADQVTAMSKELSELKPKLEVARKMTLKMMKNIEVEKQKVEAAAMLVKKDEQVANEQAAAAMELKAECEADLAQAIPILEEAIAALNTLKPTDITLVKSMKNPPDAIKLVMAAVCVMKDVKPDRQPDPATGKKVFDYWGPSKRILGDMAFLQLLKEYDKDNISPEIMLKIRKEYIPHKDFKPNVVAKASSAAEGLCKWVIAMDLYDAVAKEVAPKKSKLEVAEREYAATMVLLNQKRAEVRKLEEQLGVLLHKLQENQEKKQKLEDDVNQCSTKLFRAEKLINGLGGEKCRWEEAAAQLQRDYNAIAGDVLICSGVISYLAPFPSSYRQHAISDWHSKCVTLQIPCSTPYTFSTALGSHVNIQNWRIFGLPKDIFSTDNSIILHASKKWPLLIDPQGVGNSWVKEMEKSNNLMVAKISDRNFMKSIIQCVIAGRPALLENIGDSLDAALDPILHRTVFQEEDKYYIRLCGGVYEYNFNFKLYITCNLRKPQYSPEIHNKVRIINFELTKEGLEEQLLDIVVAKERPDLQSTRQKLIIQSAKNKRALLEVEAMILQTLSDTKGNILEDETAIETLDSSKILSQAIKLEQESSKETKEMIESFRAHYRPLASHSAGLFYCISDLIIIEPMYQYSLKWFIKQFLSSIESAQKSKILENRLRFVREAITYNLYLNVCRSLFEKDKLLFSFILCCKILIADGQLDTMEYRMLLSGSTNVSKCDNPVSWLKDTSWHQVCGVCELPGLNGLADHIINHPREWQSLHDSYKPTYENIPLEFRENLTRFQRLIVLNIIRPDRAIPNINLFVKSEMGERFTHPPYFDLAASYENSNCLCPLVFVLSSGCDPTGALTAFAMKKGAISKFKTVSLGQMQEEHAVRLIKDAQKEGAWVYLQNCHLVPSWMSALEKIWENMDTTNTSLEFRLWLSSCSSSEFPSSILQNSVKIIYDTPDGLKPNISRLFSSEPVSDRTFFEGCPGKNIVFGKVVYGLAFFHAVVQERNKHGQLGWNLPYHFDASDFHFSVKQIQAFVKDHPHTPFEEISYLTGECYYGGRVNDEWDRRTLTTLLSECLNEDILGPNYKFTSGVGFGLPMKTGYQNYLEHISLLPTEPSSDAYGLPRNAGIAMGLQRAEMLFTSAFAIEGCDSITAALDVEELSAQILSELPEALDAELAVKMYPPSYSDCLNRLLSQELEQFNVLLYVIRKTLNDVEKGMSGLIAITPELEELIASLHRNQIPTYWSKFCYRTCKYLSSFIQDLRKRVEFFDTWIQNNQPSAFLISAFYSPRRFFAGLMLNYSRKHSVPVESLTFDFKVLSPEFIVSAKEECFFILGLHLAGAKWDHVHGKLAELSYFNLFDELPTVQVQVVSKSEFALRGRYLCPLFQTHFGNNSLPSGCSSNFIIPFVLNTDVPQEHWVKRGVALLCQRD